MRLFIAIDLSEEAKECIEKLKQGLKGIKGVKPVAKENIHLTMKFLGEVADDKAEDIARALSQIKFQPFNISISKTGAFPNESRISVLWVDASPAAPLFELKKQIDAALPSFKDDHPFKSHITFARVKYIANDSDKKKIHDLLRQPVEKAEFLVDKFRLYKSTLTPEGPVYEVVKERFSA
ncbi:RNA 2',3'-cyclic phosphodiesterase [Candidatus Woesearchaeota archaeon]|nr:RNA 2',3'-cyclic phosphodiesterase [Candidatus Woesearchaeota archaeon]